MLLNRHHQAKSKHQGCYYRLQPLPTSARIHKSLRRRCLSSSIRTTSTNYCAAKHSGCHPRDKALPRARRTRPLPERNHESKPNNTTARAASRVVSQLGRCFQDGKGMQEQLVLDYHCISNPDAGRRNTTDLLLPATAFLAHHHRSLLLLPTTSRRRPKFHQRPRQPSRPRPDRPAPRPGSDNPRHHPHHRAGPGDMAGPAPGMEDGAHRQIRRPARPGPLAAATAHRPRRHSRL